MVDRSLRLVSFEYTNAPDRGACVGNGIRRAQQRLVQTVDSRCNGFCNLSRCLDCLSQAIHDGLVLVPVDKQRRFREVESTPSAAVKHRTLSKLVQLILRLIKLTIRNPPAYPPILGRKLLVLQNHPEGQERIRSTLPCC